MQMEGRITFALPITTKKRLAVLATKLSKEEGKHITYSKLIKRALQQTYMIGLQVNYSKLSKRGKNES